MSSDVPWTVTSLCTSSVMSVYKLEIRDLLYVVASCYLNAISSPAHVSKFAPGVKFGFYI